MKICKLQFIPERLNYEIPLFESRIKAGFPSPADDYIEKTLDFNEYLVRRPAATFCLRVSGDSMINAGIFAGDILVVDRSLPPRHGSIVVAVLEGEMTVKRLRLTGKYPVLMPENENYPSIPVYATSELQIWGVVTFVIHRV